MPLLPTLSRTWRFQVNQAVAGGGTGTATCQNLMFAIKQSLIGAGAWTDSTGAGAAAAGNFVVDYSCNSVSAGAKGDGSDKWLAAANCVWANAGTAHSWIVLKQAGIGATFELLISLEPGIVDDANFYISTIGFTGGTTLARPTATDEVPLRNPAGANWGGVNALGVASTLHVMNSTDGKSNRVLVCRNGVAPAMWLIELPSQSLSGWANPAFGMVLGDGTGAPVTSQSVYGNVSNLAAAFGRTAQNFAAFLTLEGDQLHGILGANQVVANDMGGGWALYPVGFYSITPNSRGRDGALADIWFGSTALVDSDTFPAAGTNNFVVFGDMILPWNTTAPTFGGGVSTARDGELVVTDAFASSTMLAPQMGGPDAASTTTGSIQYLMEAWDSVTQQQVNWVTQAPDFSGTFYPTPPGGGVPTHIAVSAVIPP